MAYLYKIHLKCKPLPHATAEQNNLLPNVFQKKKLQNVKDSFTGNGFDFSSDLVNLKVNSFKVA